jgi:hypothetical protein
MAVPTESSTEFRFVQVEQSRYVLDRTAVPIVLPWPVGIRDRHDSAAGPTFLRMRNPYIILMRPRSHRSKRPTPHLLPLLIPNGNIPILEDHPGKGGAEPLF